MEEKIFEGLKYLISYPEGFKEEQKYPLVIFLHGAGTRSDTTEKLRQTVCYTNLQKRQDARGYILLAPLCHQRSNWNECMASLIRLIEEMREVSYVDKTRLHLAGISMGGYGAWALATLRADWFASVMPVCGGGICAFASELVDLPIRCFHGICDQRVDPIESLQMVRAVNLAGGHAELILFPELGHDCFKTVFADERNYDWLLSFTSNRDKTIVEQLTGDYYG